MVIIIFISYKTVRLKFFTGPLRTELFSLLQSLWVLIPWTVFSTQDRYGKPILTH